MLTRKIVSSEARKFSISSKKSRCIINEPLEEGPRCNTIYVTADILHLILDFMLVAYFLYGAVKYKSRLKFMALLRRYGPKQSKIFSKNGLIVWAITKLAIVDIIF